MNDTITVRLAGGKYFAKALKYAKEFGGKFNATDKTWTIPTHRSGRRQTALDNPQNYGLILVQQPSAIRHDHNCPTQFGGACECDVQTG